MTVNPQPIMSNPMVPVPFVVKQVHKEIEETFTLDLVPQDGQTDFHYLPGQFNMLYVFGHGEVPISISGDYQDTSVLVHTIRDVGSITHALGQLKAGDTVGLRGPFGSSWPTNSANGKDLVIAAGGLGLAPLRPLIYHVLNHRQDFGQIHLLYGTRNPSLILYSQQLEQWHNEDNGMDVATTVDSATRDWDGPVGTVVKLLENQCYPKDTVAYVCGPEIMMRFTVYDLLSRGLKPKNIFVSMERNMKCAVGFCGHCQYGPHFVCKQGPVFSFDQVDWLFKIREV